MLYTSYFANVKNLPKDYQCYYISNSNVYGLAKPLTCVVPSWQLVKSYKDSLIDNLEYTRIYTDMLEANKEEILKQIRALPDNSVLLCYEKLPKFCHRHVLADWLKNNGIEIKEYEYESNDL